MGKKIKIGKQRRDKFYRLAKEAGLRSRAVFKLSQLNKKFEFLQQSQVLIDLCAAPGGWLQMASKYMPMSSLIIGVDLVPIKPMPNVITIQGDITQDSCRQAVKNELKTWSADCVLHDGAPNLGKNWGHDAFMQAQLTVYALRLATDVLRKGGWFVTKIFRSKDHPAVIEVLKKLFKKVFVTKPSASRTESAEIYVVCQGFLKPEKLDGQLLNPKFVFKDANLEPEKPKINLFRPEKQRKKVEGYAEGDYTLHHRCSAKEFITSRNHLDLLADANEIVIDDDVIANHPATTDEIRACCRDIKVLGRLELRGLLNWRKKLLQHFKSLQPKGEKELDKTNEQEEGEEEDEEAVLDRKVNEAKAEEKKTEKKKRRKEMKEKRSRKQKLDLNMIIPGDKADLPEEMEMFNLRAIKKKEKQLEEKVSSDESETDVDDDDMSDLEMEEYGEMPSSILKNKNSTEDGDNEEDNILVNFDEETISSRTDKWFNKEIFDNLIDDDDEDAEIERVLAKNKRQLEKDTNESNDTAMETEDAVDAHSSGIENKVDKTTLESVEQKHFDDSDNFEVVPSDYGGESSIKKLGAEGLALGEMWIHSSKTRRDLVEFGYHRFMNNDDNLPDWFVSDEKKHWRKQLPVTKEALEEYRRRLKEINARPIKKVAQAKARKRKRALRKMERARKKAETVVENDDMTERQKSQEIRKIYKQASSSVNKKPEVKYVVAKKGQMGKRASRPSGVSGRYKVVDHRMKKDMRKLKGVQNKRKGKGARAPAAGKKGAHSKKDVRRPKGAQKNRSKRKS